MDHEATEVLFQKALLTLPTQQRIAFNLRYYDELSYEEIARITGKNINTLKTNYHFATEKIKKYIKQYTS
jgi:RNA polymerase sigma-70 factor (ECF subfamily)